MKVKLDSIARYDKVSASGKEYVSVVIEANGKKMSGFADPINSEWSDGDTVNIEVETKGQYTNFTALPIEVGEMIKESKQLDRIESYLKELLHYFQSNRMYIEKESKDYPLPTLKEAQVMNKEIPQSEIKRGDIDPRFDINQDTDIDDSQVPF